MDIYESVMIHLIWLLKDLTKGKALVSDADVIEKTSPRSDMDNNNKSNGTAIPNGKPKAFHKFVKKPPGTPKTSPKPSLPISFVHANC
jgi:hypothetical protein